MPEARDSSILQRELLSSEIENIRNLKYNSPIIIESSLIEEVQTNET